MGRNKPDRIEIFIRTREHQARDTEPTEHMKESHRHAIGGYGDSMLVSSIHRWLPEGEAEARKIVEDFAKLHSLTLIIYDISGFWDNMRATIKGVKTTPTVVWGKRRLVGNITSERLEEALQ